MQPMKSLLWGGLVLTFCSTLPTSPAGAQPIYDEAAAALNYYEQGYRQREQQAAEEGAYEPPDNGAEIGGGGPIPEMFSNPILPGSHPFPSVCRVGRDYYLVTSSSRWFPGIPIYHSRDLVNWQPLGHVLNRSEQISIDRNTGIWGGIGAATIRYHNGTFYVTSTAIDKNAPGAGNFYVTAEDPADPWSLPIPLDAPGDTPSLFFENNGTAWYLGSYQPAQPRYPQESRIFMQQLDLATQRLVGLPRDLVSGSQWGVPYVTRPQLHKVGDRYLLVVSEGGISNEQSAVSVFASRAVTGPYLSSERNPVLTHHNRITTPIHAVGATDLVQTHHGDWWSVCHGLHPIDGAILRGLETYLVRVSMVDGWPLFNSGDEKVLSVQKRPYLGWHIEKPVTPRDEFAGARLNPAWHTSLTPAERHWSLVSRTGWLRLRLQPSLQPTHSPDTANIAVLARRVQHSDFWAQTQIDFQPRKHNEVAGLVLLKNQQAQYRLQVSGQPDQRSASLKQVQQGVETLVATLAVPDGPLLLAVDGQGLDLQFWAGIEDDLRPIGSTQSARPLCQPSPGTDSGLFVGLFAASQGQKSATRADFDWFDYQEISNRATDDQWSVVSGQ
ncbi:glycoside hydrolase family 43 protein [Planctomycetota bacterium]